ncbi:hypothetical protein [Zoogloea sp.]|jgi:hypothetical protein|uniref:hypothetical protein n=1 Tax=Zoogloea sp. TaxID=49181 RepID=UPI0037D9AD10
MSRNHFKTVHAIPVVDLLLDTHNPRIRHGADQNDCISRILKDGDSFLNLVRDIATEGLSIDHILISKNADGKWVVRDGNRRVTALKLLLKPSLCGSDKALASLITRIAESAPHPISTVVDCQTCDDEARILKYIASKHTGENAGVGQKGWTALMISLFNLQLGISDQNKRAAQLITWLEENDLSIGNDFPITTLSRALNRENFRLIGFDSEGEKLVNTLPTLQAYALAARVVRAIETGEVNVKREDEAGSIYSNEQQTAFFKRVRSEIGPPLESPATPEQKTPPDASGRTGASGPTAPDDGRTAPPSAGEAPESQGEKKGGSAAAGIERPDAVTLSPTKSAWDRNYLFGPTKNASPRLPIGREQKKAANIVAELRELNVKKTPIAVGMLFRCLVEQSADYYLAKNPDLKGDQTFHKRAPRKTSARPPLVKLHRPEPCCSLSR